MRVITLPALTNPDVQPYTSLLYQALAELGVETRGFSMQRLLREHFAVFHIHWPETSWSHAGHSLLRSSLRARVLLAALDFARLRGMRVVWTVHNLVPHANRHPALQTWFWPAFTRRVDGILCTTEGTRRAALERYPLLARKPSFVTPHGHFRGSYPDTITRDEARARLSLPRDARVLTYLGNVSAYKNVPLLIRTFRQTTDPGLRLLIGGRAHDGALADEVRALASEDPRIHLRLEYVPNAEVQVYLRASDLVTLPFRNITNSGSAILALSFDCPVLVPELGAMGELRETVGEAWVRTYAGEFDVDALAGALRWLDDAPRPTVADLSGLGWQGIAERTRDAFAHILSNGTPSNG